MTQSQSLSQAGSAAQEIVRSRSIRLWSISHASEQLLRVWQESQRPNVSRELAPSLLLGELDWHSTLHQLLYDWNDHDIEYYYRAYRSSEA